MRERVKFICLNRLGFKVGFFTIKTDEKKTEINSDEFFKKNKKMIKEMFPDAVKIKLIK